MGRRSAQRAEVDGFGAALPWPVRGVYFILITNAAAAFLSLVLAPGSEDWFTWTIAPDASARMLAVMYLNAFLLVAIAWSAPSWAHTRAVFVLVAVFSVTATIVTVTNFDPFRQHPWYHQAYWLGAYALLFVVTPLVLLRQERQHGGRLPIAVPLAGAARALGGLTGVVAGAIAVALFVDPAGMSDVWPWNVAPLVGRVLAVWLLSLAAAYGWVLWDGDWVRGRAIYLTAPVTGVGLSIVLIVDSGDVHGPLILYLALAALLVANAAAVISHGRSARSARAALEVA